MAIDPKKLKAYMSYPVPMLSSPLPPGLSEDDADQIKEALDDDMSEESQTARKMGQFVGYMELSEPAGAFSCGACKYATAEGFCGNREVRAYVSAENGCCNLFWPSVAEIVFPPDSKPPQGASVQASILR